MCMSRRSCRLNGFLQAAHATHELCSLSASSDVTESRRESMCWRGVCFVAAVKGLTCWVKTQPEDVEKYSARLLKTNAKPTPEYLPNIKNRNVEGVRASGRRK